MINYKDGLLNQFMSAKKIKPESINTKEFKDEYSWWKDNLKYYGTLYTKILDDMGINYKTSRCAEVGKCGIDATTTRFDTRIITTAPETFPKSIKDRIIDAEFSVPKTALGSFLTTNTALYGKYVDDNIDTFMTENPYKLSDIKNWPNLYCRYLKNIIIGMYGSLDDLDAANKYEYIKKISELVSKEDFNFNLAKHNDCWFAILASKRVFSDDEENNINIKDLSKK